MYNIIDNFRRTVCKAVVLTVGLAGIVTTAWAGGNKLRTGESWEFPEMDKQIEALRAKYDLPGVTVAVVRNDKLVYMNCYGVQELDTQKPTTNDNLFRIASISKPITLVALLKLMDEGKLKMDDTVFGPDGVLGEDFGPVPSGSGKDKITIRHLIEHKSGFQNDPTDPMFSYPGLDQAGIIRDILANRPLATKPGTKYYYSNVGYCILGRVIEKITGRPYDEYVKEEILAPCGIRNMCIGYNTLEERCPNEVTYDQPDEAGWPYKIDVHRMDSHGGWIASAADLARLMVHIDRLPGVPDMLPEELLSQTYFGYNRWEHSGSLAGTATMLVRLDDEFSFVVLANRRSWKEGFWKDLSGFPEAAIRARTSWPEKDLFRKVKW